MANRRMFSMQIIDSDAFMDMSQTAQLLYFHLAMRADDDGFIGNPRKIMRSVGSNDDDLRVLLGKRFLLTFDSGIVVIKHWRIHNLIRADRHTDTTYQLEKKQLGLNEYGAYTEARDGVAEIPTVKAPPYLEARKNKDESDVETNRQPIGNQSAHSIGKVRKGKERRGESPAEPSQPLAPKKKKPEKIACGEFKNVLLTQEEKTALVDRYGMATAKQLVTSADLYLGSTGKKYASHYLAILNWARKDKIPERSREVPIKEAPEVPLTPEQEAKMAEMRAKISEMVRTKNFKAS